MCTECVAVRARGLLDSGEVRESDTGGGGNVDAAQRMARTSRIVVKKKKKSNEKVLREKMLEITKGKQRFSGNLKAGFVNEVQEDGRGPPKFKTLTSCKTNAEIKSPATDSLRDAWITGQNAAFCV